MQKIKQQDGNWWVEDDDGLRRATDLEVDLWTRMVALDELYGSLKNAVSRMVEERIAYAGTLAHLLGAVQRAKREELRAPVIGASPDSLRRTSYFARTVELAQALTASAQLVARATLPTSKAN